MIERQTPFWLALGGLAGVLASLVGMGIEGSGIHARVKNAGPEL